MAQLVHFHLVPNALHLGRCTERLGDVFVCLPLWVGEDIEATKLFLFPQLAVIAA
jgi:hypothetical protein